MSSLFEFPINTIYCETMFLRLNIADSIYRDKVALCRLNKIIGNIMLCEKRDGGSILSDQVNN